MALLFLLYYLKLKHIIIFKFNHFIVIIIVTKLSIICILFDCKLGDQFIIVL